jgi:hypothetical protein
MQSFHSETCEVDGDSDVRGDWFRAPGAAERA